MGKFNWLFIGTGAIANKVANEIFKSGKHAIVACYSRNLESSKKFAKKYGATAYEDIDSALKNKNIEGVYIATPHSSHFEYMLKCVEYKKPILCEKTFTVNFAQAEKILTLAKENELYVAEAMWTRFNPITKKISNLFVQNKLGMIEGFKGTFGYDNRFAYTSGRVLDKNRAGGALLDTGVYGISYIVMLLGNPHNIYVEAKKNEDGVDVAGKVILYYDNNVKAEFYYSVEEFTLCKALIIGSKATIYLPFLFFKPSKAIIRYPNNKRLDLSTKRGYIYQFDKVAIDILSGKLESEEIPHRDTLIVMKILDKIRKLLDIEYPQEIEQA